MPDEPKNMMDEFLDWLSQTQQEWSNEGQEVTVYDLLTIVKGLVFQLRQHLTASEVSLAYVHAAAFMERWLMENDYMVLNTITNQPVRLELAEERRFGQNALADVEEGWVPDELPEWLFTDNDG